MEYFPGQKLLDYILQQGKLNEKETAIILKQMVLILFYLRKQGIIHRDIKAENVLVRKIGETIEVKLIDFGLATMNLQTEFIKLCGTPGYVSTEILSELNYDYRSDIYSVGCLVYLM